MKVCLVGEVCTDRSYRSKVQKNRRTERGDQCGAVETGAEHSCSGRNHEEPSITQLSYKLIMPIRVSGISTDTGVEHSTRTQYHDTDTICVYICIYVYDNS